MSGDEEYDNDNITTDIEFVPLTGDPIEITTDNVIKSGVPRDDEKATWADIGIVSIKNKKYHCVVGEDADGSLTYLELSPDDEIQCIHRTLELAHYKTMPSIKTIHDRISKPEKRTEAENQIFDNTSILLSTTAISDLKRRIQEEQRKFAAKKKVAPKRVITDPTTPASAEPAAKETTEPLPPPTKKRKPATSKKTENVPIRTVENTPPVVINSQSGFDINFSVTVPDRAQHHDNNTPRVITITFQ